MRKQTFWELQVAALGEVGDAMVASVRYQPPQLGSAAEEPFAKTNKYLQHKFLLARHFTKWIVSFSISVWKVEEVVSVYLLLPRVPRAGFSLLKPGFSECLCAMDGSEDPLEMAGEPRDS